MGSRGITKPFLLVGYFGHGNAGDEWILRQISAVLPAPFVLAAGPRRPWTVLSALRGASGLVFGGGEIFQKRTSLASLLYYVALAWLARIWRKPVFAYGISLDPDLPAWGRALVARALRGGKLWARDAAAAAALGANLAPDSVWSRPAPRAAAPPALRRVLWVLRSSSVTAETAAALTALAARTNWIFGLLPFHPAQDLPPMARLAPYALETWEDPDEIFTRMAAYDLVVSARFHGLIAAALAGRAAAAFPGHAKTVALAEELRVPVLRPDEDWEPTLRAAFDRGAVDAAPRARAAQAGLADFAQSLARGLSSKNVK